MIVTDALLAQRVEQAEANDWAAFVEALAAMPGNPYGADVRRFGEVMALAVPGMGRRRLPNRIMMAGPGEEAPLDEAIAFLRAKGVSVRVDVSPFAQNAKFLQGLSERGLRLTGFQQALCCAPGAVRPAAGAAHVRPAETKEEIEWLAWLNPLVFDLRGPDWERWMGDEMRATAHHSQWRSYIAYIDGERAAGAQLRIDGGVGSLWMAGTLPQYRGRGAQTALIARRAADARAAGCDLLVTQTDVGSISQCNMERAGFRIAYTKAVFQE
ncbi:MAG: acetyltransferase [Symbiobacteriaceae bacterium]|nr:acetyltransferase [Symbiobacteriaceae bacterium]